MPDLKKIATEVEKEFKMGGLSDGLYFDFVSKVAKKFGSDLIKEVKEIIKKVEKEPLLFTSDSNPCKCPIENGSVIHTDNDDTHVDCGKKLPIIRPIKSVAERIIEEINLLEKL